MVDHVLVFPAGDAPAGRSLLGFAAAELATDPSLPAEIAVIADKIRSQGAGYLKRFFIVLFKGGQVTLVTPSHSDPFESDEKPLLPSEPEVGSGLNKRGRRLGSG